MDNDKDSVNIEQLALIFCVICIALAGSSGYALGGARMCSEHGGVKLDDGSCANLVKVDCVVQGNGCVKKSDIKYWGYDFNGSIPL